MKRTIQDARPNAYELVEAEGLAYARERNTDGDRPYWFEGAVYSFTEAQIEHLAAVTADLHEMSVEATKAMARDPETLAKLGIPQWAWPKLRESLDREDWSLYGRFDLVWDGESHPKMLEYNADTPAALVEGAVSQWSWFEAVKPGHDQWNLMHEQLVHAWRQHLAPGSFVHLTAGPSEPLEDWNTVEYLADTVREAGSHALILPIDEVGVIAEPGRAQFFDQHDQQISTCFAMYPWEWMLNEEFGRAALNSDVRWLEPVWKVLTGSKALLPFLWGMYPDHPNLLPAYWTPKPLGGNYVRKPVYGWEGAGVEVFLNHEPAESAATKHTEGQVAVYQQYREIVPIDGCLPVLGTWVVDGKAAGLGIRETDAGRLITDTGARFVPHFISDATRSTPEQIEQWVTDPEGARRG